MKAHGIDFEERFVPQKKHKTAIEIMSQKWKSNMEKLQEWFENEKKYNWLIDVKLDAWLWFKNENLSWKTLEEIQEEYALELLEMAVAKEEWRYEEIKTL